MIIEILLALIVGILAGCFTGLMPGIHINLIASLLLVSLGFLSGIPPIALAVFIVSMSITHTFIDFIPSIFLGAPEEDTFLSILPGHKMLKQGHGFQAVVFTLYGSLFALPIIIIFTPLFIFFLPNLFNYIKLSIPFILLFISTYSILREKNILLSLIVFLLSGFLGFASFNLPIKDPLLPLLSGLFGFSSLIISLKNKTKIKKQIISPISKIRMKKSEFLKALSASLFSSPLCSFLPGISSGHAALIGSEIIPQKNKGFLFLTGSINTIIMALSFVTLYSIKKSRSGSAVAIQEILNQVTLQHLVIIISSSIIAGIISFFIGIKLARLFALYLNKINYKKLTIFVMLFLLAINIIFSNFLGVLIFITSSALGIFTILSNSRRINMMGALIIPVIIYYLTFP